MAAPTLAGLAAQLTALQTQVAELAALVDDHEKRIADLEGSDEASGWKQWRDNKEGGS